MGLVLFLISSRTVGATEQTTERISEVAAIEQKVGRVRLRGSGTLGGDAIRLRGGVQVHQLLNTPWFLATEGRFDQERRLAYDLRRWGGEVGFGWEFNETTSLLAKYRLDRYKVFNTGSNVDPAFRTVAGHSEVAALGAVLQHDSRDDSLYPTQGVRVRLNGELAIEALGGDYDFGRLETDMSVYTTPFHHAEPNAFFGDVTFVEHVNLGWVENFGDTDDVPFFERYFVGGTNTVRGHRNRWLTPRGLENQFVGGEIQLVNNLEARVPILTKLFNRQLSAAVFFDAGRAFRRFSDPAIGPRPLAVGPSGSLQRAGGRDVAPHGA